MNSAFGFIRSVAQRKKVELPPVAMRTARFHSRAFRVLMALHWIFPALRLDLAAADHHAELDALAGVIAEALPA